jgi:hypothetical protein
MRLGRILGIGVLLVAGCAVAAMLVILWRWNMPSAAALELAQVVEQRPPVPDADNGYIYMWGFTAAPEADVFRLGTERVAWLQKKLDDPDTQSKDPLEDEGDLAKRRSRALRQLATLCRDEQWQECAESFDDWREAELIPWESVKLARYRTLLGRSGWRETVSYFDGSPLAPFSDVLDGQRLRFLQLRGLADAGKIDELRDALDTDLRFWRLVFRNSDTLITRMIAVAGVRQHFCFGNLLLRRLPPDRAAAAIPAGWTQPFTIDELSLLRTLAGELEFVQSSFRKAYAADDGTLYDEDGEVVTGPEATLHQWMSGIGKQLRPPQRQINRYAELQLAAARAFTVPVERYNAAAADIRVRFPPSVVYPDISDYAFRSGSAEVMRRAALLTAQLRSLRTPAARMAEELRIATLRDPFTSEAFGWNTSIQAVQFDPAGKYHSRALSYLY